MRIKTISIILTLSTLIILLVGCIKDNAGSSDLENLVGTWQITNENEEYTFDFYENKSFYSYYIQTEPEDIHKGWGTFEFDNSKLCMYTPHGASGGEETYCYTYVFSENNEKLTLSTTEIGEMVLIKIS